MKDAPFADKIGGIHSSSSSQHAALGGRYRRPKRSARSSSGGCVGRPHYEQRITSKVDRLRIYTTEITELKKAQNQLRASRERLRALYRQMQLAREKERTQIAREVHDELGQVLASAKLSLSRLAGELPRKRQAIREKIQEISHVLHQTIRSVRKVCSELRPAVMDVLELKSALQWQVRKFRARRRVPCKLAYQIKDVSLDQNCCTAVFRICQEVLNHVAEHTKSSPMRVAVKQDQSHVVLEVGYHGNRRPKRGAFQAQPLTIAALREFVLALGGELQVQEKTPQGTLISARVPLRRTGFNRPQRSSSIGATPRPRRK